MIKSKITLIPAMLISLVAIFLTSCSSGKLPKDPVERSTTGPAALERGVYGFTLLDSSGAALVELELDVVPQQGREFSGISKITRTYSDYFKGYGNLTGGSFTGSYNKFDSSIAVINMSPDAQDNNIFLTLHIFGKYITGTWSYSTFTGITNRGTLLQITK